MGSVTIIRMSYFKRNKRMLSEEGARHSYFLAGELGIGTRDFGPSVS